MLRMVLIAGFVWAAAGTALAADGVVTSTAFEKIPPGSAIVVKPWDNSDQNIAIQKDIENALVARGFAIRADAPLLLSFETRDTVGTWSAGDRRSIVEFERTSGGEQEDESKVRLNLYQSDRGGVFNQGRPTADVKPSRFQIEVTLDGQHGVRLWQGTAVAAIERTDRQALIKKLVPPLIRQVGNTVKGETFPLR